MQAILRAQVDKKQPNLELGRIVFKNRCVLCHGEHGYGDVKLSKVIKNPPPYNLTTSVVPDKYLQMIIEQGGQAVGRSKHMPPWGNELTETEIRAVILYVKQLRGKH